MSLSTIFQKVYKPEFDFEHEFDRLTAEQKRVIQLIVEEKKNVFLTGPAGTGKSEVFKLAVKLLRDLGREVGVTATTGAAAVKIGGTTMHSYAGLGWGERTAHEIFNGDEFKDSRAYDNLKSVEVWFIDECSMLKAKDLQTANELAGLVRKAPEKPFGGIQVVFSGDFLQLPPPRGKEERDLPRSWIFECALWKRSIDYAIKLERIFRQDNPRFIKLLANQRVGIFLREDMDLLRTRVNAKLDVPEGIHPPILYVTNKNVDEENLKHLKSLDGPLLTYEGWFTYKNTTKFQTHLIQRTLKEHCLTPEKLELKVGAHVMHLVNKRDIGLHNGSVGVVKRIEVKELPSNSKEAKELRNDPEKAAEYKKKNTGIVIYWDHGAYETVYPHCFKHVEGRPPFAEVCYWHYPLRLARAITIHKCQGATFNYLILSTAGIFEPGMHYTALSRVRTLEGLCLLDFHPERFQVDQKVLQYYDSMHMQEATDRAQVIPKGFITSYFEMKKNSPHPESQMKSAPQQSTFFLAGTKRKELKDVVGEWIHPFLKKSKKDAESVREKAEIIEITDDDELFQQ